MKKLFLGVFLCSGCPHVPPSHPVPHETRAKVAQALAGAATVATVAHLYAKEPAPCIAYAAIAEAAGVGAAALLDKTKIPAISVDVSKCLDGPPPGADLPAFLGPILDAVLLEARAMAAISRDPCIAAVLGYVAGASGPILDEVGEPDGAVAIPGADLAACSPAPETTD